MPSASCNSQLLPIFQKIKNNILCEVAGLSKVLREGKNDFYCSAQKPKNFYIIDHLATKLHLLDGVPGFLVFFDLSVADFKTKKPTPSFLDASAFFLPIFRIINHS